jgi:uncharacterized protein (DUF58 family)
MFRHLARPRLEGLKQRVPAAPGSRRSVFFNRVGLVATGVGALIGIISGNPALTWIGALVLVTAAVGAVWNRYALARVEWTMTLAADRAFPGDRVELALTVFNNKLLPVPSIAIETEMSAALEPVDRPVTTSISNRRSITQQTRLGPYERVTWRIAIRCRARGIHTIGPAVLRASDPLGLFASKQEIDRITTAIVYPRVHVASAFRLPARFVSGETRVSRQLVSDPLRVVGIREYGPEDPMKSIHWKATARQGQLQVRVTEPTTSLQFAIFANIDTFNHYWEGLDIETAEAVIEIAASLAVAALDRRWSVGLASNGIVANYDQPLRIGIARGPDQRLRILDGLARLSPYSSIGFTRLLAGSAGRLPPGSTVCLITSLLPDGLLAQMRALLSAGHNLILVPVGDCPIPVLRGMAVRSVESLFADSLEQPAGVRHHG